MEKRLKKAVRRDQSLFRVGLAMHTKVGKFQEGPCPIRFGIGRMYEGFGSFLGIVQRLVATAEQLPRI